VLHISQSALSHHPSAAVIYGRDAEWKVIQQLLRRAQRGKHKVVLVDGEPGIGKSALLKTATDEAAAQGFSLVAGAADQLDQEIPFLALRKALREPFSGSKHLDDTSWWISHVYAHLEQRAAVTPVLVCLDDLHWASPATLAVLRVLSQDMRSQPIAWLLSRASSASGPADHTFRLLEKDGATRVSLAPLDPDAVAAMVTDAFGAPADHSLHDLARGAAGNPSLVAELIAGLREDRAVDVADGSAVLLSTGLPRRIHQVARQRLDGLSKQARNLLVTTAVLDPTFRLEDAAEMLGETPAALLPAVTETMDAAIMAASDHTLTFRHQLLRRAIGDMLPQPVRTALHRQYGEILLSRGGPAARAATHLLRAAHPGDHAALAGLDQAAEQTLPSAPQTAADLAARALELTSPADPSEIARAVAAAAALTAAGRLDQAAQIAADTLAKPLPAMAEDWLKCVLSSALRDRGEVRNAADLAEQVLAGPEPPPDLRDEALTALFQARTGLRDRLASQPARRVVTATSRYGRHVTAAALVTLATTAWDEGRIGDALDLLRDSVRHDPAVSPDARRFQPLLALAAALIDLRQLGEAVTVLNAASQPTLDGIPAQAGLRILRGRAHLAAGQLAEATAEGQAAASLASSLGAHAYAATAHGMLSMIELCRGDIAAAAQHITSRGPARPLFSDIYARPEAAAAHVRVAEAAGGPAAALDQIRQLCTDLISRPGLLVGDPALTAWLVRTALATDDVELAARMNYIAQSVADAHPQIPVLTAAAVHSRGLVDKNPALLAEAVALYPDPWARSSAAEDLGVLYRRQNDRDQAIRHLKEALGGYFQVGAGRDQARVRRRLRHLGIRRRHWTTARAKPVTGWDSLTGTEQAVARSVAEGLNNSQVARRMYISPHTVASHLRQAFRKLSISSRVELTRIVLEHAPHESS
jgi:DNA-binding CsgD family transcriptional regulator/tetratricopeptide (TPR) repeat protein